MRRRIANVIGKPSGETRAAEIYDWYIMLVAVISVLPMAVRGTPSAFVVYVELITVYLLFFDYILHWITYDYKIGRHSPWAFFLYPVTPFAIMDLLGILPSLGLLPASFMIFRLLRLSKVLQYSKSCRIIVNVFKKQKKTLLSVLIIALAYILISALTMFAYEPVENFPTFFDALYWATTALTTVGYGDVFPTTIVGKVISMVSSLFGIAVIAMPAAIVTSGFIEELSQKHDMVLSVQNSTESKNGEGANEDE